METRLQHSFRFVPSANGRQIVQFEPWLRSGRKHCFTGSAHDFSLLAERRAILQESFADLSQTVGMRSLYLMQQEHGATIVSLTPENSGAARRVGDGEIFVVGNADALLVDEHHFPGSSLAIGVRTADCVPLLLRRGSISGVVHAGWRGLANRIILRVLEAIADEPGELQILCGPAADGDLYQVGAEVVEAIGEAAVVIESDGGRLYLDVQRTAERQIQTATGGRVAFFRAPYGTISDQRFHSYRREKAAMGSNLAAIVLG